MDTGARSQHEWKDRNGGAKLALTRRLISAATIVFASLLQGSAAAQTPLTALTAILQRASSEADKGLPVALETAVAHFHSDQRDICAIFSSSPFFHDLRSRTLHPPPEDIAVLAGKGWKSTHNLMELTWFFLVVALAVGMCGWYLEYKDRRQIISLAYVEHRRSSILEDINHSRPLAGILERITELVSMRLNGAACWCQVADGATLGNHPRQLSTATLRTVEHPIASRSGPPLGAIYAAFPARAKPGALEQKTLIMGAELATLAIETSRLYSDLVHRSEFDQLTDVPNRFSMQKALDALIQNARQSAAIFGVIYIDLNEFKQVNDVYGHLTGDLYLQEVARRMKSQLRPGDTLARLGGDEFTVLVSKVHNRAEVEEIAMRLEGCFAEPFIAEEFAVYGSASVGIALYPEDANSADGLLSAADAAMYVAKNTRTGKHGAPEDELAPKD